VNLLRQTVGSRFQTGKNGTLHEGRASMIALFASVLATLLLGCGGSASDEAFPVIRAVIHHGNASEAKCKAFEEGRICRDPGHWIVEMQGKRFTDPDAMDEFFKKEADLERTEAKDPYMSQRHVVIQAEPGSPWSAVHSVIRPGAKSGIYKFDLIAAKPGEKKETVTFWLFTDTSPELPPIELRLLLRWDPVRGVIRRKFDPGEFVSDDPTQGDRELIQVLETMAEERKADRFLFKIYIDAGPDVPLDAVVHTIELCRKNGFERVSSAHGSRPLTAEPERAK